MLENTIHPSCFESELKCISCGYYDKGLYCSNCGAQFHKPRITLSNLMIKFVSALANIESKFVNTFKSLLVNPIGFLKGYLLGERDNYCVPFRYLLINLSICFFISRYFIDPADTIQSSELAISNVDKLFDQIIHDYGKFYFLLIIPIFTLSSKLLNPKTNFNMAEIATAITFLLGQMMCMEIVLNLISAGISSFYPIQKVIIFIAESAIVFLLNRHFFNNTIVSSIWKSVAIMLAIYMGMKYALILTHELINISQSV
jgi:hypothetical protein